MMMKSAIHPVLLRRSVQARSGVIVNSVFGIPRSHFGSLSTLGSFPSPTTKRDAKERYSFLFQHQTRGFSNGIRFSRRPRQDPTGKQPNEDDSPSSMDSSRLSQMGAAGTAIFVLAGKTKYVLGALKLLKMGPLVSLLASTAAYSFVFGFPFAVGMVSQLLVHESGHAAMMYRMGIPFSPMIFVPFLGAGVAMEDSPKNAFDEAKVALAGPLAGGSFAAATAVAGVSMDSQLLMALGEFGLFMNLFNLLPIGTLDGGRVANAVSKYAVLGGTGIGASLVVSGAVQNPIFILITLFGGFQSFQRVWYGDDPSLPKNFYNIGGQRKATIVGGYLALIFALLGAQAWVKRRQKSPEQIRQEKGMQVSEFQQGFFELGDMEHEPHEGQFDHNKYFGDDGGRGGSYPPPRDYRV